MSDTHPRRFTTVAAPNVLSAIGDMLRKAFAKPGPSEFIDRLLMRLDRS